LHQILFDWSGVEGVLTTGQRFEIGEARADNVLDKTWKTPQKMVVVGSFPAINGLAALVASNRGFSAQTFPDLQQALDWLGVPREPDGQTTS
jgi:hypothetical protein